MAKKHWKINDESELTIFEVALCEDLDGLAKIFKVTHEDVSQLREDMRALATYWIATMNEKQRARINSGILQRFESDLASDTAWLMLRDLVNEHMPRLKGHLDLDNPTKPRSVWLDVTPIDTDEISSHWNAWAYDITEFFDGDHLSYGACKQCGKPFLHKSSRAIYCSDACRVAASRARA